MFETSQIEYSLWRIFAAAAAKNIASTQEQCQLSNNPDQAAQNSSGMRAKLRPLLRVVGATILLIVVAQQVEFGELLPKLRQADAWAIVWSAVFVFLVRGAMAWRLQRVAQQFELFPSYHAAFAMLMSSSLAGFVLPGGIAQDVVRGLQLNSLFGKPRAALSVMLLDKYFGIIAILPIGVAALFYVGHLLPGVVTLFFYASLAGVTLATLCAPMLRDQLLPKLALPERLERLIEVVATHIGASRSFTELMGLSLLIQGLRCCSVVALFYAFDVGIDPLLAFVYVPIVVVVIIAPVSIGGLGVREAILLLLFVPLGADADRLVLVGFISLMIELLSSLPGFYYVLRGIPQAKPPTSAAESS